MEHGSLAELADQTIAAVCSTARHFFGMAYRDDAGQLKLHYGFRMSIVESPQAVRQLHALKGTEEFERVFKTIAQWAEDRAADDYGCCFAYDQAAKEEIILGGWYFEFEATATVAEL